MAACETDCVKSEKKVLDDLDDPGAAPYGNFINYYTFNPPENRLSLIPSTLLQDLGYNGNQEKTLILDVGCNSGELSVSFYEHLQKAQSEGHPQAVGALHLLGFDLDENLILRAQQNNPLPQNISFTTLDITKDTADQSELVDYLTKHRCSEFDVCLCLAVTMWVHLNHGDAAFLQLLSRLASISQHLLLEAQPWKCYRSAARRLRKLGRSDFDHFKTLRIRGEMAEHATAHLEQQCGMELIQSFGSTTWDRRLLLFKRR